MDYANLFLDAGYETDLHNHEQKALKRCNKLIEFIELNGRMPKSYSTDDTERSLAGWSTSQKIARKGTSTQGTKWYPSLLEYAISKGHPTIFDSNTIKALPALDRCHVLGKWIKDNNNKVPSYYTKCPIEKSLSQFIGQLRRKKAGKSNGIWNPELDSIMKAYNHADIFDVKRDFKIPYDRCQSVIDYRILNGRYPLPNSTNKEEKFLGIWVTLMRRSKMKDTNTTNKFYPEIQEMVEKAGYPYAFENKSGVLERAHAFCIWYKKNIRLPDFESTDSSELEIIKLYNWLKFAYNSDDNEKEELILKVFVDMEIEDIDSILKVNLKELALNEVLDDLINFYTVNGRPPHKLMKHEVDLVERWEFWSFRIIGYQKITGNGLSRERFRQLGMVKGYKEFMDTYFNYIQKRLVNANMGYLFLSGNTSTNNMITKSIDYSFLMNNPELHNSKQTLILNRWYKSMLNSKKGNPSTVNWFPLVDDIINELYKVPVREISDDLPSILSEINIIAQQNLSVVESTRVTKLINVCKCYGNYVISNNIKTHNITQWFNAFKKAYNNQVNKAFDWIPLYDDVINAFGFEELNKWSKNWHNKNK